MSDRALEVHGVRAFVAVVVPDALRPGITAVQQRLRVSSGVKWVEPENLHFTLRFLGHVPLPALDALAGSLTPALAGCDAFPLTLAGVGAFPNVRRPRAVWIGVTEGAPELERLARAVEDVVVDAGFEPEPHPFRAHLTVGRVKVDRPPVELVRVIEAQPVGAVVGHFDVEDVVLMRSELRRGGPIYTPLASFALRPRA